MDDRERTPQPAHETLARDAESAPTSEFLRALAERTNGATALPFDEFVDLALYDARVGYYRQPRHRVGYGAETDFFTATTSGSVFGELVVAAIVHLLGARDPARYTFVEVGAERAVTILDGIAHPFARAHAIRIGDALDIAGKCIVFSNELFDAQPFRRFRFREGRWRELGVERAGGTLREVELEPTRPLPDWIRLPADGHAGYVIDAPVAAARLAGAISRQPWQGLFVAFDYGKTWRELVEACPAGTGRGYYRHTQTDDLLARPGRQDLTCHVCWDWMDDQLRHHGFATNDIQTQESFFVRHAESYLAQTITADAAKFTARKQSLMQLLHGAHLGQKFQVLTGIRDGGD